MDRRDFRKIVTMGAAAFEKVGLPDLEDEPVSETVRSLRHGIYSGFIAPVSLYAVMGAGRFRNRSFGPHSAKALISLVYFCYGRIALLPFH